MTRSLFIPRDIFDLLRRRALHMVVPFLLALGGAAGVAYFLPDEYESEAVLRLHTGLLPKGASTANLIASTRELLTNRTAIASLAETISVSVSGHNDSRMEEAAAKLKEAITVSFHSPESFTLTVSARSPLLTQQGATKLSSYYEATISRLENEHRDRSILLLQAQVDQYRRVAQEELGKLQTQGQSPDESAALRNRLMRLDAELNQVGKSIESGRETLALIEECARDLDNAETAERISTIDAGNTLPYLSEAKTLSSRYAGLLKRYTSRYPEVESLRRQLLALLDKSMSHLWLDIEDARSRSEQYQAIRTTILNRLPPTRSTTIDSQGRHSAYNKARELYDDARLHLEQAKLSGDAETQHQRQLVIEPPSLPTSPSGPQRTMIVLTGGVLGAILALVSILAAEYFDPVIRTHGDLEVFRKPILASIP